MELEEVSARTSHEVSDAMIAVSQVQFSGPAGAFKVRSFDANLFFVCAWDVHHQKLDWKGAPICVWQGKESTVCRDVGIGLTCFHHET
eukprot:1153589-Pelagomonas_calceolata.AAC.3